MEMEKTCCHWIERALVYNGDVNSTNHKEAHTHCCDSLLIAKAAAALNTRRGGLKAKHEGVDVGNNE